MYQIMYTVIVLIATTLGAIAGFGGGVIIKPTLDVIGIHNITEIGFYSACCVFTMSLVSIYKQKKNKAQPDISFAVILSFGSILGGVLGENLFNRVQFILGSDSHVKFIQALVLLIILAAILLYTLNKHKLKSFNFKSKIIVGLLGITLGAVSIFLGIGGGPLNVALLTLLFSVTMKEAIVYSIITIFFSQISKLSMVLLSDTITKIDITPIYFLLPSAILGGYIGSVVNAKLNNKKIEKVYIFITAGLMLVCIYNIWNNI